MVKLREDSRQAYWFNRQVWWSVREIEKTIKYSTYLIGDWYRKKPEMSNLGRLQGDPMLWRTAHGFATWYGWFGTENSHSMTDPLGDLLSPQGSLVSHLLNKIMGHSCNLPEHECQELGEPDILDSLVTPCKSLTTVFLESFYSSLSPLVLILSTKLKI